MGNTKQVSQKWSNKINDFQVLVIHDENDKNHYKILSNEIKRDNIKENIINVPIFQDMNGTNTFIIWQQSYQENKELFFKLRLNARNEVILRIAKVIVAYLLNKYEDHTKTPISDHPKLNEKKFVEHLIQKFNYILKNDSFLADYEVWDDFCNWFKTYLTDWVLEDMENTIGLNQLEKMTKYQLNELFIQYITKNTSGNSQFMLNFRNIVNVYIHDWINKIIYSMKLKSISVDRTLHLLDIEESSIPDNNPKSLPINGITSTLAQEGNLVVMSNAVYQSVREALSNHKFKNDDDILWPTALLNKGTVKGIVQLRLHSLNKNGCMESSPVTVQKSWDQSKEISELDVDVLDALCSFFLSRARHHTDMVEIRLDDLLSIRGLKPKLGGDGRRGGYEEVQRNQILKALSNIQNLWIDLEKVVIYEKGKSNQRSMEGRAFIFKDLNQNDYYIGEQSPEKKFLFTVGDVFSKFLYASGRQVALLPIQALQYNPYQELWEKKLTRYLSWRWRTQARNGEYLQPHKISTLLDTLGIEMNERTPSRTRERLEKAFDILLQDGVIAAWQYEKWDEDIASNNGWARIWKNSTIIIDPPEVIKKHYEPIERNRKKQKKTPRQQRLVDGSEKWNNLGAEMKTLRKKLGLTLLQVAEEMEISVSYLSNIERGTKIPSSKIKTRMENWMKIYI